MSLTNELQEAINKNLPSMVGEQLVKRLDEADRDRTELQAAKALTARQAQTNGELLQHLKEAQEALAKHTEIDVRETAIKDRERLAEAAELRTRLDCAEKSAQFARDVALGLVRNTEFRRDVFNSNNGRQIAVPSGGYVGAGGTENSSTSITEQTK